jgi:hypothetical protein
MNSARKQTALISNPTAVLRIISSPESKPRVASLNSKEGSLSLREREATAPVDSEQPSDRMTLKLHVDPSDVEVVQDDFQLDQPPTRQVDQLVNHLRNQQKELAQREADLQAKTYESEKKALASEAALKKRCLELEQHISQVKRQQAQLVKLQQSLVDGQEAIGIVVEKLVAECNQDELKEDLEMLHYQLQHQFESNFNQWERLLSAETVMRASE